MAKTKKTAGGFRLIVSAVVLVLALASALAAYTAKKNETPVSLDEIPAYTGEAYVEINGNVPFFTEQDWTTDAFETYSELDALGRCGVAYANVCAQIMPTEPRGQIGSIRPSGWHTIRYNGLIEGNYLYHDEIKSVDENDAEASRQLLASFARMMPEYKVDTALRFGNPGPEIIGFAKDGGFDAILMTRSSRGCTQKMGSVSTYIVRNASFIDTTVLKEA